MQIIKRTIELLRSGKPEDEAFVIIQGANKNIELPTLQAIFKKTASEAKANNTAQEPISDEGLKRKISKSFDIDLYPINNNVKTTQIIEPVKIINVGNVDDKSSQGPASITPIVNHTDRLEQARLLEKEEGKSSQIR